MQQQQQQEQQQHLSWEKTKISFSVSFQSSLTPPPLLLKSRFYLFALPDGEISPFFQEKKLFLIFIRMGMNIFVRCQSLAKYNKVETPTCSQPYFPQRIFVSDLKTPNWLSDLSRPSPDEFFYLHEFRICSFHFFKTLRQLLLSSNSWTAIMTLVETASHTCFSWFRRMNMISISLKSKGTISITPIFMADLWSVKT